MYYYIQCTSRAEIVAEVASSYKLQRQDINMVNVNKMLYKGEEE